MYLMVQLFLIYSQYLTINTYNSSTELFIMDMTIY